ncbi:hypothetical protein [Terriglobus roseus]|uniref:Uncharacterized protein n=1 Tax=Terriglobus roseus TaxID=392734 RepID=A0A1G7F0E9_9BACT|nr:hypothetical protein [Terriglobus roseus]SDE69430.1 hypothetical protein SAMN05444167_0167 [Terriglobus roseus]
MVVDGVVVVVDVEELAPVRPVRPLPRVWVELPDGVVCVVPLTDAPEGGVIGAGDIPGVGDRLGVGDLPGAVEGVDGDGVGATPPGAGCSGKVPGAVGNAGAPGFGGLFTLGGPTGATG